MSFVLHETDTILKLYSMPFPGGDLLGLTITNAGKLRGCYRFRYYEGGSPDDPDKKSFFAVEPKDDTPENRDLLERAFEIMGNLTKLRGSEVHVRDVNGNFSKLHAVMLDIEGLTMSVHREEIKRG